ncbi:carbohydrate ABC transporter permease [Aureimonas psammosilenae]|uniref:carbohydrate ABC transporter permease n=1 Tax=Aureimonas psammosilenae TaxID=2495496 RepID=UPI001260FE80|nr:carbohydrate ABC transporter permease [Aureimonas psammosilenae]
MVRPIRSIPRSARAAPSWLTALKYLCLGLGAVLMLLPFADLILGALRTPAERLARPQIYFPATPQWGNFEAVFLRFPLGLWIWNSFFVTTAITAIQLATSVSAGYALAKFRFPGRDFFLRFVIGAQLFPFFLFIIPLFFILRYWPLAGGNDLFGQGGSGFLNSYAALILPFSVSWYGIFLMRQFMISVPDDLLDAARMDGAGEFRILWSIVLPLVRPALVTLGVFVFVYHWNEVVWTLTITRTAPELQTAPIGIHLIRGAFENEQDQSLQQAATLVTVLPVVILFLALQRFYVRSLSSGLKRR